MEVVKHPYLEGVLCREDGAVFVPAVRGHEARWTFGSSNRGGYRYVCVKRKLHAVHRLICEAFHGACPPGKCQVDHINRGPSNNRPENLRWVSQSENNRNRAVYSKYGVSYVDDVNTYQRTRYAKKKAANQLNKSIMTR